MHSIKYLHPHTTHRETETESSGRLSGEPLAQRRITETGQRRGAGKRLVGVEGLMPSALQTGPGTPRAHWALASPSTSGAAAAAAAAAAIFFSRPLASEYT